MPLQVDPVCVSDEAIQARATAHQLTITEPEQRSFLAQLESLDLQAAPGCGKTTLTGLKLCLLASGWHANTSGVCVLSHTNVAKNQIIDILQRDADGRRFLSYPHYIGTIQGFVDTFLAMPYLRSLGTDIRVVDDEYFARAARSEFYRGPYAQLRNLANPPNARTDIEPLVQTAHYVWEEDRFVVRGTLSGRRSAFPFGPTTASTIQFLALKEAVSARGVFTYADMYAHASKYLYEQPQLLRALRLRFPFVLIDEMQDTSNLQEEFLNQIFVEPHCVIQRVGDVNQRIYAEAADAGPDDAAFPKAGHDELPRSMRFGPNIAAASTPLTITSPQIVTGNAERPAPPPRLILFDENTISLVLPRFAREVIQEVPAEELSAFPVKAVGARKTSGANQFPKDIKCYWPDYNPEPGRVSKPSSMMQAIAVMRVKPKLAWKDRTEVLWDACCELLSRWNFNLNGKRPSPGRLKARLAEAGATAALGLRRVLLELSQVDLQDEQTWNLSVATLSDTLKDALQLPEITANAEAYLEYDDALTLTDEVAKRCEQAIIPIDGTSLTIDLATIHSVKGETHAATLVLECFHLVHDLKEVLPVILGRHDQRRLERTQSIPPAVRRTFVAMTRPRALVAFAVRAGHFTAADIVAFSGAGWSVIDLTAQANA